MSDRTTITPRPHFYVEEYQPKTGFKEWVVFKKALAFKQENGLQSFSLGFEVCSTSSPEYADFIAKALEHFEQSEKKEGLK